QLAGGAAARSILGCKRAAFAGIDRLAAFGKCAVAVALQIFRRAETQIGFAFAQQALSVIAIDVQAVALAIRREWAADIGAFVPIQSQPAQVFEQLSFKASLAALHVGILN